MLLEAEQGLPFMSLEFHSTVGSFALVRASIVCLLVCAGCGGAQNDSLERETSSLKPLSLLYGKFLQQHRGQPPKSEADFKKFIGTQNRLLETFKVANADALFTQTRDGRPYVLIYGKLVAPAGPGGMPVFAYEAAGQAGRRFVATGVGAVAEVDETEFKRLVPNAN